LPKMVKITKMIMMSLYKILLKAPTSIIFKNQIWKWKGD
jgi:hypothetical protein